MTSKFVYFSLMAACALSLTAAAQTSSPAASVPNAPSAMDAMTTGSGTKIATINIQGAIEATNEGQRDLEALFKKLEPKQNELKSENDELDSLKKQLNTQ